MGLVATIHPSSSPSPSPISVYILPKMPAATLFLDHIIQLYKYSVTRSAVRTWSQMSHDSTAVVCNTLHADKWGDRAAVMFNVILDTGRRVVTW